MTMREKVIGVICGFCLVVALIFGGMVERNYTRNDLTVVRYSGYTVTVQDNNGHTWTCATNKRYLSGDKVKGRFDSHNTEDRNDDTLIRVR